MLFYCGKIIVRNTIYIQETENWGHITVLFKLIEITNTILRFMIN